VDGGYVHTLIVDDDAEGDIAGLDSSQFAGGLSNKYVGIAAAVGLVVVGERDLALGFKA